MTRAPAGAAHAPHPPAAAHSAQGFLATFGFFVVINLGGRSNRAASQAAAGGGVKVAAAGAAPALFTYRIVKELPHDPAAFTQGLQYDRRCADGPKNCTDVFWESTGEGPGAERGREGGGAAGAEATSTAAAAAAA